MNNNLTPLKSHRVEKNGDGVEDENLLRQSITSLFDRNMRWKNSINESMFPLNYPLISF
jgi:hypothetical protein